MASGKEEILRNILENQSTRDNFRLIMALVWIARYFHQRSVLPLIVNQFADSPMRYGFQNDLIDNMLKITYHDADQFYGQFVVRSTESLISPLRKQSANDYRYALGMWFVDSLDSAKKLYAEISNSKNRVERIGLYVLVYTGSTTHRDAIIRSIMKRLFDFFMIEVNVIYINGRVPYIYTFFPYSKEKCTMSKQVLLYTFDQNHNISYMAPSDKLYPYKLRNMYGCKIRVLAVEDHPFTYILKDENGNVMDVQGIEGSLIKLLANLMNFSIEWIEEESQDRGVVYPNGTITGATKKVVALQADVAIGGFGSTKIRNTLMTGSKPYIGVYVTVAMPKGKPFSGFVRMTRPFKYIIWSCLSSSILFGIISIYCLKFFGNHFIKNLVFGYYHRTPCTNLLQSLFGVSLAHLPTRNFSRYILAIWLLYSTVMRTAYSGELFIMLQDGRTRSSITTLTEALKTLDSVYVRPSLKPTLEYIFKGKEIKLIDSFENTEDALIQRIVHNNEQIGIGLGTFKLNAKFKPESEWRKDIYMLPQKVIFVSIAMFLPRNSPFLRTFDDILLSVTAAGMVSRYTEEYVAEYKSLDDRQIIKLSLNTLYGIFDLHLILLTFACFIFFMEILSKYSKSIKKILDFLNY